MAKTRIDEDLFRRLHADGLRKRAARTIAEAANGRGRSSKAVKSMLDDLKSAVAEVEDRVSGGPAKRRAAARKAAATRKRNAQTRSLAAKKGARTRASRSS